MSLFAFPSELATTVITDDGGTNANSLLPNSVGALSTEALLGLIFPFTTTTALEVSNVREVSVVSPTVGDVHKVSNALSDRASISIHVYGANIGAVSRHVFDPMTGAPKEFISGYSNETVPNLWDLSGS